MSDASGAVVIPFATFLEVRARRRRISAAFQERVFSERSDRNTPVAAPAVALAGELGSAVDRPGSIRDDAVADRWTPGEPESPGRESR